MRYGGINREEVFSDLHVTRLVAELAGLVRKYKGRFILSRDCRRLQAEGGLAAVYPKLFRAYVEQLNWAYRDGYPELRFIQSASLFTLYLLTRYGDNWRPHAFYEDSFLRACPTVLKELPPDPVFTPEEEATATPGARWCISQAFWGWPRWNPFPTNSYVASLGSGLCRCCAKLCNFTPSHRCTWVN